MPCMSAILILVAVFIPMPLSAHAQARADEVRLLFTGDIMSSRQVRTELKSRRVSPCRISRRFLMGRIALEATLRGLSGRGAEGEPGAAAALCQRTVPSNVDWGGFYAPAISSYWAIARQQQPSCRSPLASFSVRASACIARLWRDRDLPRL